MPIFPLFPSIKKQTGNILYSKISARDRELIVESSNRGEDWISLANIYDVNYKTAYTWIRLGEN